MSAARDAFTLDRDGRAEFYELLIYLVGNRTAASARGIDDVFDVVLRRVAR